MRIALIGIAASVLLLLCTGSVAQEIPAEKKELIKELNVVTNFTKNAEAMRDSLSGEIQKSLIQAIVAAIERDRLLTNAQRAEVQRKAAEAAQRSSRRFRELFSERVNYSQLLEEVSFEIYNKHYTTEELEDLVTFYKTPTGRKTIEIMPQIFAESMTKTSERLRPQIGPIVQQLIDEETKVIEQLLPKKKPSPRKRGP